MPRQGLSRRASGTRTLMTPDVVSASLSSPGPLAALGRRGAPRLQWGASTAAARGPVVATLTTSEHRNAIGTHSGGYSVYRALAIASRALSADHRTDLTDTAPADVIG